MARGQPIPFGGSAPKMPQVDLLYGPPLESGDYVLRVEVLPRIRRGAGDRFIFLTQSAIRRADLEERAARESGCGCAPRSFFTPAELLRRFSLAASLPRSARRVLVGALALRAEPGEAGLRGAGSVAALDRLVAELGAAGIENEARLGAVLRTAEVEEGAARRLRTLFGAYRRLHEERGLVDEEALQLELVKRLRAGEGRPAHLEVLVVEGLSRMGPLLREAISLLAAGAGRVLFCADLAAPPDPRGLGPRAEVDRSFGDLLALARELGAWAATPVPTGAAWGRRGAARLALCAELFGRGAGVPRAEDAAGGAGALDGEVEVASYPDAGSEAEAVAGRVRELLDGRGAGGCLGPEQVVVACARPEEDGPLAAEALRRAGVPCELCHGERLDRSPLTVAALALLRAGATGLPRTAVVRALLSPYLRFADSDRALDPGLVDTWCRLAGVRGGGDWRHDWIAKLELWVRSSRRRPERADEQLTVLATALETLAILPPPAAPREKAAQAIHVLRRFEIAKHLEVVAEEPGGGDLQAALARRDRAALLALERVVLWTGAALELAGVAAATGADLLEALALALRGESQVVEETARAPRVRVVGLRDARGLAPEVLFLFGLGADALPGPHPSRVLLDERTRERINRREGRGVPLLSTRELELEELRGLFGLAVASPRRRVVLSYPREGLPTEEARSPFLDELLRRTGLAVAEEGAPYEGASPILATPEARQIWLGLAAPPGAPGVGAASLAAVDLGAPAETVLATIRLEDRRASGDPATTGRLLGGEALRSHLSRTIFEAGAVHSASALDEYARCPFAFFARRVLRIEPLPEVEVELPADRRGILVHDILSAFHRRLLGPAGGRIARGPTRWRAGTTSQMSLFDDGSARDAREGWIAAASRILLGVARRVLTRHRPAVPDVFFAALEADLTRGLDGAGDARPGLLRSFLETEADLLELERPVFLEEAFGREAGRRSHPPLDLGEGLLVSGRIDRVDARVEDDSATVLDYKAGGFSATSEILAGLSLQLPIYLLAVRELLGREPSAAGFYSVRVGHGAAVKWKLVDRSAVGVAGAPRGTRLDLRDLLARVPRAVQRLVEGARAGLFNPAAHAGPAGCRSCDYASLCRLPDRADRALLLGAWPAGEAPFVPIALRETEGVEP
jgi:ATP-dependent helicase/nuclease subunit B